MKRFEEVKIKMVMKLKRMTRKEAVEEIARLAANRHTAEREKGLETTGRKRMPNIGRLSPDDDEWGGVEFKIDESI